MPKFIAILPNFIYIVPIFIDTFHEFYGTAIVPTFIDIVPFLINIVPTYNLFLSKKSKFGDFDTLMPRGVPFGEFQASQNILFPTAKDEWNPKIEEEKNVLALVNILYCSVT